MLHPELIHFLGCQVHCRLNELVDWKSDQIFSEVTHAICCGLELVQFLLGCYHWDLWEILGSDVVLLLKFSQLCLFLDSLL